LPGESPARHEQDAAVGLHAIVRGFVQGVGFRYFVLENARRLGLVGAVRNLRDGSVEVEAEGSREALERFLAELQRGPRSAQPAAVEATWGLGEGRFQSFSLRYL
jgi:acylphosphatase